MEKIKKYLYKTDKNGFINTERERLEKYLMIGLVVLILAAFAFLVIWVLRDNTSHRL